MNVQDLINELVKLPPALKVVTPVWDGKISMVGDKPQTIRCVEVVPAGNWYGCQETVVSLSLTSVMPPK
jgi:hypothetical protein